MEEGPEPQEWVEKTVEHHEQSHEAGSREARWEVLLKALTAAVLAVLAAFGSLLSGHAANEAILNQMRATDQWAYYQAKSTKGHLYEVSQEIVSVLTEGVPSPDKARAANERFARQVKKYDAEKEEVRREAERLEEESRHELHKHHRYSLGIAAFQVGIVLASIAILVRHRAILGLSFLSGAVGIVFLLAGLVA